MYPEQAQVKKKYNNFVDGSTLSAISQKIKKKKLSNGKKQCE